MQAAIERQQDPNSDAEPARRIAARYQGAFMLQVLGWSMSSRTERELAMNALLMAVWRRQPKNTVMVHSGQMNLPGSAVTTGEAFSMPSIRQ